VGSAFTPLRQHRELSEPNHPGQMSPGARPPNRLNLPESLERADATVTDAETGGQYG